jgi:hypothetical protein
MASWPKSGSAGKNIKKINAPVAKPSNSVEGWPKWLRGPRPFWPQWPKYCAGQNFGHGIFNILATYLRFWPLVARMMSYFGHASILATEVANNCLILATICILATHDKNYFGHACFHFGNFCVPFWPRTFSFWPRTL